MYIKRKKKLSYLIIIIMLIILEIFFQIKKNLYRHDYYIKKKEKIKIDFKMKN